jgi:hypothetical protein
MMSINRLGQVQNAFGVKDEIFPTADEYQKAFYAEIWGNEQPMHPSKPSELHVERALIWIIGLLLQVKSEDDICRSFPFAAALISAYKQGISEVNLLSQPLVETIHCERVVTSLSQLYALLCDYYSLKISSPHHAQTSDDKELYLEPILCAIPHFRMVERGTLRDVCYDYVFKGDPFWGPDGCDILLDDIYYNPEEYLTEQGWMAVPFNTCAVGDVICYLGDASLLKGMRLQHVGVVSHIEDGSVILMSKFGLGPIYEHEMSTVPPSYGDTFFCIRRPKRQLTDNNQLN